MLLPSNSDFVGGHRGGRWQGTSESGPPKVQWVGLQFYQVDHSLPEGPGQVDPPSHQLPLSFKGSGSAFWKGHTAGGSTPKGSRDILSWGCCVWKGWWVFFCNLGGPL